MLFSERLQQSVECGGGFNHDSSMVAQTAGSKSISQNLNLNPI